MPSAPRAHPSARERAPRGRRAPELATLLLELLRVVKARRLCGPGDPQLVAAFGRAARAWQTDLDRHGDLDLHLGSDGFRPAEGGPALSHPRLAELLRLLAERGVFRIRFTRELDADGLGGFVEALATDAGLRRSDGGFGAALYALVPCGIVVNEKGPGEQEPALAFALPEDETSEPGAEAETWPFPADPQEQPEQPEPPQEPEPPHAAPGPGDGWSAEEPDTLSLPPLDESDLVMEPEPTPAPPAAPAAPRAAEPSLPEAPSLFGAPPGPAPLPRPAEAGSDAIAGGELPPTGASQPSGSPDASLDLDDPDDTVAKDVRQLIAELRACTDGSSYMDLARRASYLAERTSELDRDDLSDRLLQALSEDAQGKASDREREAARSFLASAMQGRRIEHLIERIATGGDAERIAASQLVLSLGEEVVPALLAGATASADRAGRDRIHAVLISMGDRLLPEMMRMLESDEPEDVLGALRLAGETQHPAVVPRLADFLASGDTSLREEAGRALVRVGGDEAILALARAVRSETPGVAALAVQGLGSTGSHRAAGPLRHALDRALDDKDADRAKDVVRALGRLGHSDVAAPLAAVLQRKTRFGGRWLKDLKVAAASALAGIPGDEAVGALAQAAHSKDAALRRAAQTALDRRAQALAREGQGAGDEPSPRGSVR